MKEGLKILMLFITIVFFVSCSKIADDAAKSASVKKETINGKWKHSSGALLEISITTGKGVYKSGPAPSGAVGGNALTMVTYEQGLYWEARSHTYYSKGWSSSYTVIGIAMAEDQKTFKIGTQVYTRQ